jgi:hypothetical protein
VAASWNDPSYVAVAVKPTCPTFPREKRFPCTDYCFHADLGEWNGYSSPCDDGGRSELRKFREFSREFLMESARERAKEMAVFALVVLTSAWPVIYMVMTVVNLLSKGRPLEN